MNGLKTILSILERKRKRNKEKNYKNKVRKKMKHVEFEFDVFKQAILFVYAIVFIVGATLNLFVLFAFIFVKKLREATSKFIINMTLADLLVVFVCVPTTSVHLIYPGWILGKYVCYASTFVQSVSLSVSVLTLTAISFNRYYIINKPLRARAMFTKRKEMLCIVIIWLVSLFIMSPLFFTATYHEFNLTALVGGTIISYCIETWPSFEIKLIYEVGLMISMFVVPTILMAYAYYNVTKKLWLEPKPMPADTNQIPMTSMMDPNLKEEPDVVFDVCDSSDEQSDLNSKKVDSLENEEDSPQNDLPDINEFKIDELYPCSSLYLTNMSEPSPEKSKEQSQNDREEEKGKNDADAEIPISCVENAEGLKKNSSLLTMLARVANRKEKIPPKSLLSYNTCRKKRNEKFDKNQKAIQKLITSRQRVVKLFIVLAIVFVIFWLPYHIVMFSIDLIIYFNKLESDEQNTLSSQKVTNAASDLLTKRVFPFTLCLALANSAVNPICFILLSKGFRQIFKTAYASLKSKLGFKN